jgi:DNA (cytosine-5)-methyltransferase 1
MEDTMNVTRYFSTFSGIGGFERAISQAAKVVNSQNSNDSPEPVCIGYSEIDKYASQVYATHYPTHTNYGDITKINATALPDFELLVGGFPCQAFSIAGKRAGFSDTRGTLFFDLARILKAQQPRLFLFENVKGLLSHNEGRTFYTIISTLDELGYDCQWQVLNSKDFGVPHNRERVFIVGHLRGTPRPEVFPIIQDGEKIDELSGHYSNTLTARYEGAQANGTYIGESKLDAQIIAERGRYKPDGSIEQQYEPRHNGLTNTLTQVEKDNRVFDGINIRRFTPIECERLQGFPDNWTASVSDSQRYKCCGNAVTVNTVQAIMEKLLCATYSP